MFRGRITMPVDEALAIRYLLVALGLAAVAYGLWWFLFRRPPRPSRTPVLTGSR